MRTATFTSAAAMDSIGSIPPPGGSSISPSADGLAPGPVPGCFPRSQRRALVRDDERPVQARAVAGEDPDSADGVGQRAAHSRRSRAPSRRWANDNLSLNDLAPHQNQLQIDLVGLGLGSGESLRYQYRPRWRRCRLERRSATNARHFLEPPAGPLSFLVRAVSADGIVSPAPATVAFEILRPRSGSAPGSSAGPLAVGLTALRRLSIRVARLLALANLRRPGSPPICTTTSARRSHGLRCSARSCQAGRATGRAPGVDRAHRA